MNTTAAPPAAPSPAPASIDLDGSVSRRPTLTQDAATEVDTGRMEGTPTSGKPSEPSRARPATPTLPTRDRGTLPGVSGPFSQTRFFFTSGTPAGETTAIRDGSGNAVLTYRSFASVVGVVAALMACIVTVTGLAAIVFLVWEGRLFPAAIALLLSITFALVMARLVPPINVTLFDGHTPSITIAQTSRSSFPVAKFAVVDSHGRAIAHVRRTVFSRLGRNRWRFTAADDTHGYAVEESLVRAISRKLFGKFARHFDANVFVVTGGQTIATMHRRTAEDLLELAPEATLDRRILIALATLVYGSEP